MFFIEFGRMRFRLEDDHVKRRLVFDTFLIWVVRWNSAMAKSAKLPDVVSDVFNGDFKTANAEHRNNNNTVFLYSIIVDILIIIIITILMLLLLSSRSFRRETFDRDYVTNTDPVINRINKCA